MLFPLTFSGSRGYGDDDSVLIKRQTLAALTKTDG